MKGLLFLLLAPLLSTAQTRQVAGQIQKGNSEQLADASIVLLDSTYQQIREMKTDLSGKFELTLKQHTKYYLKASHLNFGTKELFFYSDTIKSPLIVTLIPKAKQLEEVNVVGRQPRLIRKLDRLEFNVQHSNLSALNTWDILKRTPLVMANGSDLMVRGSKKIMVLINDRKILLSGEELKTYLENTAGNDVQSIEVITNPPA
ncbi:MAG: TonB-dependent receptor, partial [Sphingobacterium sp.]